MNILAKQRLDRQIGEIFFSMLLVFVSIVVAGWLLQFHHVSTIDIEKVKAIFLPDLLLFVSPKPEENFLFVTLLFLLPFFCMAAILVAQFSMPFLLRYIRVNVLGVIFAIVTCLLFFSIFYNSDYLYLLTASILQAPLHGYFITAIFFLVAMSLFFEPHRNRSLLFFDKNKALICVVMFGIIVQSFAFRVFDIAPTVNKVFSYIYNPSWRIDFNAVFYSVSQVMVGKTVLADVTEQYGLYAEFLKPIFLLIGLSVFKFTLVMAALQMMSLAALFLALMRLLKNRLLVLLAMLSFCYITGGMWRFVYELNWNPYFQYFPIRLLFPTVSVLLALNLLKRFDRKNLVIFSFFSGMAMIWNLDAGVPVVISFLALLGSFLLFPRRRVTRLRALFALGTALVVILGTLLAFGGYLWWKSGGTLHLAYLTQSQKIFYYVGFNMLPLPKGVDPWQAMCGIYTFGLVYAFYGWWNQISSIRCDTIFYLSLLGFGLFAYYEGRAHVYNLISVTWPAFMIVFILVDATSRQIKAKTLSSLYFISCIPVVVFSVLLATTYIYKLPFIFSAAKVNWHAILYNNHQNAVEENIRFIKQHVSEKNKKVVILSAKDAIYLEESGLASAIKGPGLSEMGLTSDVKNITDTLLSGEVDDVFIEVDAHSLSIPFGPVISACKPALKNYHVVAKSRAEMIYLSRTKDSSESMDDASRL